jgi:hypothetical protein
MRHIPSTLKAEQPACCHELSPQIKPPGNCTYLHINMPDMSPRKQTPSLSMQTQCMLVVAAGGAPQNKQNSEKNLTMTPKRGTVSDSGLDHPSGRVLQITEKAASAVMGSAGCAICRLPHP